MTVSNGGPSQSGQHAKTAGALPNQAHISSAGYAHALTTASDDTRGGARVSTPAETRSQKAEMARGSTAGVARSMGGESQHAALPGEASKSRLAPGDNKSRDDGGAHTHARSSAHSASKQGKAKAEAASSEPGKAKNAQDGKKGDRSAKDSRRDKASTHARRSEGQGGNVSPIDGKKLQPGGVLAAKAGAMSAKDAMAGAAQSKLSSLSSKFRSGDAKASPFAKSWPQGRIAGHGLSDGQRAAQQGKAHPNALQGALVPSGDMALQQPSGPHQPMSHQQTQNQVIQVQAPHQVLGDAQHHYGGLGVGSNGKSFEEGGVGWDRTPLGQSILALLFGMQGTESEADKVAMAEEACSSCADGDGDGSLSDYAGGMSSLEQLFELLKELVGRSVKISGGEKNQIFGLIDRFLGGRTAEA